MALADQARDRQTSSNSFSHSDKMAQAVFQAGTSQVLDRTECLVA